MYHVFIAPHLDDAVLSCGELIYTYRKRGDPVFVITVFTHNPKEGDLSQAAMQYHANCFFGSDSMSHRKEEDRCAAQYLDFDYMHLDFDECLYRKDNIGNFIYSNLKNIYHYDSEKDIKIFINLSNMFSSFLTFANHIYVPYGLGNHADHLLIRNVFEHIRHLLKCDVYLYEEIPYLCYMTDKERETSFCCENVEPTFFSVTAEAWHAKVQAILFYRSQLHIMWKNETERLMQLRNVSLGYTDSHCLRLWTYK
jgi:LmbE family N-acetylglucosaminyl deacetylase